MINKALENQPFANIISAQSQRKSFSFEATQSRALPASTAIEHHKFISHSSIDDKIFSSQSQQDTFYPRSLTKQSILIKKELKTESADNDNQYQLQLKQEEYELRIQSLTKQFELKLSKQQEFYQLREWKLKEQVDNLNMQISLLESEVKKAKNSLRQEQNHCSLCSDGTVINHLNNVIKEVEENHKDCLTIRKELMLKCDQSKAKAISLQEENQKLYQQLRRSKKENRQQRVDISDKQQAHSNIEKELKEKETAWKEQQEKWSSKQHLWREKEQTWKAKQEALEKKIIELTKTIEENKNQKQKEESTIENSKISVHSIYENEGSGLRGSFLKQNKENMVRNHGSLPKGLNESSERWQQKSLISKLNDIDDRWGQSNYKGKLNERVRYHPSYQRMQRNKWRYY